MYVDEVGNADFRASQRPEQRYLSLTGIMFELDYVESTVFPVVEGLKHTYFGSHPDEPVILHRKEVVQRKPPFDSLKVADTDERFRADLLRLFRDLDYVVFTATIDKLEHHERYKAWRHNPYHYCLEILVERFALWLEQHAATGDIMAESRGGNEDVRLKEVFRELYQNGTSYIAADRLQVRLTSRELKVKPKAANVAGLQLADLIAYPSSRAAMCRHQGKPLPSDLNGEVAAILEASKYDRSPSGRIDGWGRKWLP